MPQAKPRNPLMPWYIGLALIVILTIFIGYRMFAEACPAPGMVEAIVLGVIPVIYLALMYITLKSQD